MNILENLKNNILNNLKQKISLFEGFENVYLFGSVLCESKIPNDIDILLIYSQYSNDLINNLNYIDSILSEMFEFSIDFTVLSMKEQENSNFLKRLNFKYVKLK